MKTPIIFCHYGNSKYLSYTLEAATLTNPDKDVILLGDQDNKHFREKYNIKHYLFEDYRTGIEIETFDRVYKLIQGKRHNNIKAGKDWVKFVFKRWFYVYNFVISQGIDSFWHFDSDNMILTSLAGHEYKFKSYDCTEQCNGICMNGFISSPKVVSEYLKVINDLCQNEEYLKKQQQEFADISSGFAFTEMRAYAKFKKEKDINSIRLNSIIKGSVFDDCICSSDGMEMEHLGSLNEIKKVYFGLGGKFFCVEEGANNLIKLNSLNMSYVYNYYFKVVLNHLKKQLPKQTYKENNIAQMATMGNMLYTRYLLYTIIYIVRRKSYAFLISVRDLFKKLYKLFLL